MLISCTRQHLKQDYVQSVESELTLTERGEQLERRETLERHIEDFRDMQTVYMPCVGPLLVLSARTVDEGEEIENQQLWLPSALNSSQRESGCHGGVVAMEALLREAQCCDALDTIRSIIRSKMESLLYRDTFMHGQAQQMHAVSFVDRMERWLKSCVVKYQVAREALLSLKGTGAWETELQVLQERDVVSLEGAEFTVEDPIATRGKGRYGAQQAGTSSVGEGYKVVPWIWTIEGVLGDGSNEQLHESECLSGVEYAISHFFKV